MLAEELSLLVDDTDPNYSRHLATVMFNVATVYWLRGDHEKAHEWFVEIKELYPGAFNDRPEEAFLWSNLAAVDMERGALDTALTICRAALAILKDTMPSNHQSFASLYHNIGIILCQQGHLDCALEHLHMALKIWEPIGNRENLVSVYLHLGYIQMQRGELNECEMFYEKAMALLPEEIPSGRTRLLLDVDTKVGAVLTKQEKLNVAAAVFTNAPEIYGHTMIPHLAAECYSKMMLLYSRKHQFDKALTYATRALSLRKQTLGDNHPHTAVAYCHLAELYHLMGDDSRALEFFTKCKTRLLKKASSTSQEDKNACACLYQVMGTFHLQIPTSWNLQVGICTGTGVLYESTSNSGASLVQETSRSDRDVFASRQTACSGLRIRRST
ncbi:unnamed protein product [Didymodactylos carnosus]|uniref:MalT-like TPR region domain-containing protein n=2 Tax=Didymodactylos carnosus TaxID=1234261 RepID=A0A8S2IKS0_9BILA|nr:unnamed protein product [Didymodactylos carnosus]CAF3762332.1 unnamed protein product [Didymodactylos carnosus]